MTAALSASTKIHFSIHGAKVRAFHNQRKFLDSGSQRYCNAVSEIKTVPKDRQHFVLKICLQVVEYIYLFCVCVSVSNVCFCLFRLAR